MIGFCRFLGVPILDKILQTPDQQVADDYGDLSRRQYLSDGVGGEDKCRHRCSGGVRREYFNRESRKRLFPGSIFITLIKPEFCGNIFPGKRLPVPLKERFMVKEL
ncbi:uncharacterized protein LOC117229393 [Megalopta genalis]|uniref:uncharacterized protein LOC117229393 n=1 Tax=Megalopta genalis TaxID=115081 RepID=UPI003FD02EC6